MAGDSTRTEAGAALAHALREAEAAVAAQAREIATLREQGRRNRFAEDLRQALVRMGAAGQLTAPVGHNELLDLLVTTAAQVLQAQAASLYLLDYATNELVFEVALGESADRARKFRVPVGQGIAGWVAATGQPVAIADASQDARFAVNIARSIGYIPKSVLCIPMRSGETVIGVVQLFDRADGQPFTPADMELLGHFADQAAVAIEQSRAVRDLAQLFAVVLQGLLPGGSEDQAPRRALETHAREFSERAAESEQYREALQITQLVAEVSRHDPEARRLCQQLMASVAEYVRSQARLDAAGGCDR
jgi:GAF domain-containing protein